MRFASNSSAQVGIAGSDWQVGRRVANDGQIVEVAVRVAGLALSGRTEQSGDFGEAFDVGLVREVLITAVGLGFTGEGGFQVVVGVAAS
jgi:hypothetical protein